MKKYSRGVSLLTTKSVRIETRLVLKSVSEIGVFCQAEFVASSCRLANFGQEIMLYLQRANSYTPGPRTQISLSDSDSATSITPI